MTAWGITGLAALALGAAAFIAALITYPRDGWEQYDPEGRGDA